MRSIIKSYLPAIIIAIGSLITVRVSFIVIALGGDSCCGENTTKNMLTVTLIITAIICSFLFVLYTIIFLIVLYVKKSTFSVREYFLGMLIAVLPIALVNLLMWLLMSIVAFGLSEFLSMSWL